jgi:hypothetical protein
LSEAADCNITSYKKKKKFYQFETPEGEYTMEFEGYCVKCHKKQPIKDGTVKESPNGRRMVQGTCPECKTKVTRFLPKEKAE